MAESYQLKTQQSATGKKIYYKGVASHIIIDPSKGDANDNWFTDPNGIINIAVIPDAAMTKLITILKHYSGSGWQYGLTSDETNPAGDGKRVLIITGGQAKWVDSLYSGGSWSWDTENPIDAGDILHENWLYYETLTGKLYMYDTTNGMQQIATPGAGGGSGSSDVSFVSWNNTTYPNPSAW